MSSHCGLRIADCGFDCTRTCNPQSAIRNPQLIGFMCSVFATLSFAISAGDAQSPRLADERIVLRTICGDIVLALYPDVAPHHVAQLLKLTQLGVYNTTHFVRIEPNFVIQFAEAQDRPVAFKAEQKDAIHTIKAEFSSLKHVRGVLSMARADNAPDSGETSFSILLGNAPHLDGQYTIFGRVESGMEVVDILAGAPLAIDPVTKKTLSRPITRLTVLRADVVKESALKDAALRGPIELPEQIDDATLNRGFGNLDPALRLIVIGAGLIVVVALIGFLVSSRFQPNALLAFNLINALIAGILFFMYVKASGLGLTGDEALLLTDRLDRSSTNIVLTAVASVAVIGLVGSLLVRRRAPKMLLSFNLINVLIGGFLVFALAAPLAPTNSALALGLFLGLISIIKLMSQFET